MGEKLSRLAALLALPLGVRVATVEAEGDYDTHDDQPGELASALSALSQALAAFQLDLETRGIADRVLTFVWSEFGRRVESNESQGTDHGAGGIAWVRGNRARPGILTDYPDIARLDEHGNLAATSTSAASTRRCSRAGWGPRRTPCCRARPRSGACR